MKRINDEEMEGENPKRRRIEVVVNIDAEFSSFHSFLLLVPLFARVSPSIL